MPAFLADDEHELALLVEVDGIRWHFDLAAVFVQGARELAEPAAMRHFARLAGQVVIAGDAKDLADAVAVERQAQPHIEEPVGLARALGAVEDVAPKFVDCVAIEDSWALVTAGTGPKANVALGRVVSVHCLV